LPELPLTLFCTPDEAAEAHALGDSWLAPEGAPDADRLSSFDVVVKSPGISPYRPEARAPAHAGTAFIGGPARWFAGRAAPDVVARGGNGRGHGRTPVT